MPRSDFWPFDLKRVEEVDANGGSSVLQKQLGDMEGEVKEIQMELAAIRKDRLDLYNRKNFVSYESASEDLLKDTTSCNPMQPEDNYKKYSDVAKLREELIRAKNLADEEKFQRVKYEGKLKDLEMKLNNICCTGQIETAIKEVRKHSDGDVAAMKSEIREMKEEMEELKLTNTEKTEQLEDYRAKYLQAQQYAEELKQQLDVIEYDNKQVSDQIQIEIQRMKMQFQEKLHELAPLPDLLKGAQMQLHEARQVQKIAEDSAHQLNSELIKVKEKLVIAMNNLNQEKVEKIRANEENKMLKNTVDEKQKEIDDLYLIMDEFKCNVLRLQEKLSQQEIRFKEKSGECAEVIKSLEELRTESHRSINRCKERSDSMRRHLQTQISELERQLIQSRAQCKACQKERDEMRQRMQMQISNIQENFELVEMRLRALQTQVSSLKSSYAVILNGDEEDELNKITT